MFQRLRASIRFSRTNCLMPSSISSDASGRGLVYLAGPWHHNRRNFVRFSGGVRPLATFKDAFCRTFTLVLKGGIFLKRLVQYHTQSKKDQERYNWQECADDNTSDTVISGFIFVVYDSGKARLLESIEY
jgi:hypothetical protein